MAKQRLKRNRVWSVLLLIVFVTSCATIRNSYDKTCSKTVDSYNYLIGNIKNKGIFYYAYGIKSDRRIGKGTKEVYTDVPPIKYLQKETGVEFEHIDSVNVYLMTFDKLSEMRDQIESNCNLRYSMLLSISEEEFQRYDSLSYTDYFLR